MFRNERGPILRRCRVALLGEVQQSDHHGLLGAEIDVYAAALHLAESP